MKNSLIARQSSFEKSTDHVARSQGEGAYEDFFNKDEQGKYRQQLARALWDSWCRGLEYARSEEIGSELSLPVSQEPKYSVVNNLIVNRSSGNAIPPDEPIFILRARDVYACDAIEAYASVLTPGAHRDIVVERLVDFSTFSHAHPERMKTPDTVVNKSPVARQSSAAPPAHHMYAVFRQRSEENDGQEFLHYAMWHGDTTLEPGERQVRGFFFVDSSLPGDN